MRRFPIMVLCILLLAFAVRVIYLDNVPPGWRDDELINILIMSQKIGAGNGALFYPDASGHEALIHGLREGVIQLVGLNLIGGRILSAYLGLLGIALTYRLAAVLFDKRIALLTIAGMSLSFWGMMYARFALRHIGLPVFALSSFILFWEGMKQKEGGLRFFVGAGIWLGLGFYTYFASRGVPLILLAMLLYLLIWQRPLLMRHWGGVMLMFGTAVLLSLPLWYSLQQQPEAEARVAELALPLIKAQEGDYSLILEYSWQTLRMVDQTGDGEWLYNIPNRPIFGSVGGILFWLGMVILLIYTGYALFEPLYQQRNNGFSTKREGFFHKVIHIYPQGYPQTVPLGVGMSFLFCYWLAGISPAFISVPPASYGHTILAYPAVYMIVALPIWWISYQVPVHWQKQFIYGGAIFLLLLVGGRDIPDYFVHWRERGNVRFLYRADIRELAGYVQEKEMGQFGVSSLLAGPWDQEAFQLDLGNGGEEIRARWFNPSRALFIEPAFSFSGYPVMAVRAYEEQQIAVGEEVGGYQLYETKWEEREGQLDICFVNGLCVESAQYDRAGGVLEVVWYLSRPLDLPEIPLVSNPPPPGVYAGARLSVFAQMLDEAGGFVAGDDGLWVDPVHLYEGDRFVQLHLIGGEGETAVFGLYDPKSGERILTVDGASYLVVGNE